LPFLPVEAKRKSRYRGPAASGEERQKPISLFEGVHSAIKTEQRSDMNIWQQYYRPFGFFIPLKAGWLFLGFSRMSRTEREKPRKK
jgi:hypothetical protein